MDIKLLNSVAPASFLNQFMDELRKEHNVDYTCALNRSYKQQNSYMENLIKRWKMYGGFGIKSIFEARGTQDLSIITTNPFFNPSLVSLFSKKQTKTINLLWDLFPDALELAGLIKRDSFISKILEEITFKSLNGCSATVFIGKHIKKHVESRYGRIKNSAVIPVGADGREFRNFPPVSLKPNQRVNFLYSGNLGRLHDSHTLYEAINCLDKKVISKLIFQFHSSGIKYNKLCNQFENKPNVAFFKGGKLPQFEWVQVMKESHVGIVSMMPGAEKILMPSKTYSSLVAGQAILAICPHQSDLADLVLTHDCGWVIESGDTQGLTNLLKKITSNHDELLQKRKNAFKAGHKHYDMSVVTKDWLNLIGRL